MSLVRISVYSSTTSRDRAAIADAVYEAMQETIGIPEGDRFIVVTPHGPDELFIDATFKGVQRTEQYVLVQIFLSRGRTTKQKQALYARVAKRLFEAAHVPADDVMIVLNENGLEDWSYSKGEDQFVLDPPAWARKLEEGK
jgi:4-oxalocrotonate tautomerase